jgi:hypothetical protein
MPDGGELQSARAVGHNGDALRIKQIERAFPSEMFVFGV